VIRLAHFVTHPIQYFVPLYRELAKAEGIDLTVLFGSDYGVRPSFDSGFGRTIQFNVPLLDGYAWSFLKNRGAGLPTGAFSNFNCPELPRVLRAGHFDAVWIHGWGYLAHWQAMWGARSRGIPYLLRSETTDLIRSRGRLRGLFRRYVVRAALRSAAGCLYIGRSNRRFLEGMGVSPARLFPAHYAVDVDRFRGDGASPGARRRTRQLRDAGDDDFVILTCAKALPHKRLQDPIEAVKRLGPRVRLWIVGDGPERRRLEGIAAGAGDRIRFLGFVNQGDMPGLLHAADAFVLASESEPWGLAVNEAMACGLPVVCSDRCGCAADLIREGVTGFTYPTCDVGAMADRLGRLLAAPAEARRMGRAAQELVAREYDVKATARQVADAVRIIVARGSCLVAHGGRGSSSEATSLSPRSTLGDATWSPSS
jgi:glycosyltransferase involved in cell wall biosynthesis